MPPFREDVKTCFGNHNKFAEVLGKIAHGRIDNGRPLAAETVRQMARDILVECGVNTWTPKKEYDVGSDKLCGDCPPGDYPTDKTRCLPCPRRQSPNYGNSK